MPKPAEWTPEQDQQLIALAAKRMSAKAIAVAIGKSKNAVLGRANRMRAKFGIQVGDPRDPYAKGAMGQRDPNRVPAKKPSGWALWYARKKQQDGGTGKVLDLIRAARAAAQRRLRQERRDAMKTLQSDNAVHIIDRKFNQCAWPLWCDGAPFSELNMCGNRTEDGKPYCAGHCEMAHGIRVQGHFVPMKGFVNSWRPA